MFTTKPEGLWSSSVIVVENMVLLSRRFGATNDRADAVSLASYFFQVNNQDF
jgi:hypothetical protein